MRAERLERAMVRSMKASTREDADDSAWVVCVWR